MSSTNKIQAWIIAERAAMFAALPFKNYLKPDGGQYNLDEVNKTDLLGHYIDIRFSEDGLHFIYSDSSFEYDDGHFDIIKQMGTELGIEVRVITSEDRLKAILSDSAGDKQIGTWVKQEAN